jgi:hypothetical protein
MQRGQDWCLECGTAAPGRLGAKPGWRAAFTVVGLTTLLLCCAIVAIYAALTGDAERTAAAPPAGSGDPITAQVPAPATGAAPGLVQPGVTGPGVTAPATPSADGGTPIIPTTKPPLPSTNTPIIPSQAPTPPAATNPPVTPPPASTANHPAPAKTGTGSTAKGNTATGSATTATSANAPVTIELKKDAARTYDPVKRAGAEFGPAAYAIDDKPDTVWDVTVPADGEPIAAGLVIDLGKPYALRSLRLDTPTDGFTVEVYGAKSAKQLPEDVIDKRWIHLTDKKFVLDDEPIVLKGKGGGVKVQLLLLHFTTPADPDDPRVAIGNVKLRGTP